MIWTLRWGRVSHLSGYAQPTKTAISKDTSILGECSEMQNFAGTEVSDWHKTDITETRFVLGDEAQPKNAAISVKVNGANLNEILQTSLERDSPRQGRSAMSLHANDNQKRATKSLGYVLTAGTSEASEEFVVVLERG